MKKTYSKLDRESFVILSLIIVLTVLISLTDAIISPPYFVKSGIKLLLFGVLPIVFLLVKREDLSLVFRSDRKVMRLSLILGIFLIAVIIGGFFLLRKTFDFSAVTESLTEDEGITKEMFPFVAIYIATVNSFLEEFFFRFFGNTYLAKSTSKKFAFYFSPILFSLYHVAIMDGWFSPFLTLMLIVGLALGGAVFNFLDRKGGILPSWILHISANIAINSVGIILFYI